MKTLYRSIAIAMVAALFAGCNNSGDDLLLDDGVATVGEVRMSMTRADDGELSSDEAAAAMAKSVLRISDNGGNLIRRYAPATTAPESLELMAATGYSAEVWMGDKVSASFSADDRYYWGEESFDVSSASVNAFTLTASMQNTLVKITFDETIAANLVEGYSVVAVVADAYSTEAVDASDAIKLTYTADESGKCGYFLMPTPASDEDVVAKNISWKFSGERIDADGAATGDIIELTGVIANPQAGDLNNLTFKYNYEMGLSLGVSVDATTDKKDDWLDFQLQPVIAGSGFTIGEAVRDNGASLTFDISSSNPLAAINLKVNNTKTINLMSSGTVVDQSAEGVTYAATSDKEGTLTVDRTLIDNLAGGYQNLKVEAVDNISVYGSGQIDLLCTGVAGVSNYNDWMMTADLEAAIADATHNQDGVVIEFAAEGTDNWTQLAVDKSDAANGVYRATVAPQWSDFTNEQSVATKYPTGGISSGAKYEYRMLLDGTEISRDTFTLNGTESQLPNSDMEDSGLACWSYVDSNKTNASSNWVSGNNSFTKSLCAQSAAGENHYAKLTASSCGMGAITVAGVAAGNLLYGQFAMASTSGTVNFGQPFAWGARPRKFKFKYSASLGEVDQKVGSAPLNKGDKDIARVFIAIVDWSDRHQVTAGTSGKPSNPWNPSNGKDSSFMGDVIGYASLFITEDVANLTEIEIPFYYYDTVTKPSKNISVVVSCATCAYGDYMTGSTKSTISVDDFEIVY